MPLRSRSSSNANLVDSLGFSYSKARISVGLQILKHYHLRPLSKLPLTRSDISSFWESVTNLLPCSPNLWIVLGSAIPKLDVLKGYKHVIIIKQHRRFYALYLLTSSDFSDWWDGCTNLFPCSPISWIVFGSAIPKLLVLNGYKSSN